MDLAWLTQSTENPAILLSKKEELNELLERFPQVASLHIYRAKLEQLENGLDYQDYLKLAAVYAPNRQALYNYSIKPRLEKALEKQESETEDDVVVETSNPTNEKPVQAALSDEEIKAKKLLEKEILTHAISSSILQESDAAELVSESEINTSSEDIIVEEETNVKPEPTDHSMSVLQWLGSAQTSREEPSAPAKKKQDLIADFIKLGDEKIQTTKEPQETRVTIHRQQTEFFSPENIAKMSLAENEDFVTETLAKIYAKQGNNKKAISAYEKLSLKFPEKSNYFARLIQELKEN